jgi:gliding motility-associated-like protein
LDFSHWRSLSFPVSQTIRNSTLSYYITILHYITYLMKNTASRIILCLLSLFPALAFGQNLIQNGNFNALGAGWTTSCTSIEAYAMETTYGGTDPTNHVAEIDDEACMHQDVCVIPGSTYIFGMDASRRNIAPATVTTHINIIGLDASGSTVATYVNMDFSRSNTLFALTPVTGIPAINVPLASGVVRLRVTLTDNTPGYSTLGMIVDNISLTFTTSPLVTGPTTTCVNAPITLGVSGLPASGITYSWSFGPGATPTSSTASSPSASWNSAGTKTVSVGFSNGVCYAETLAYTVVVAPAATATISPTICDGDTFSYHGNNYTTTGDYLINFTSAGGCDSTVTLHLVVNPIPAAPVAPSPTYCQFDLAYPLGATGSSLLWYGPGVTAGYGTAPSPSTASAGAAVYYVTQTVAGCTSDSTVVMVTIHPKPAPPIVRDTAYCQNETVGPLTATGSALRWYTTSAGGTCSLTAPVPATGVVGASSWYVSQVVGGCESDKAMINVSVAPKPAFHIESPKTSICLHDTLALSYNGTNNVAAYNWSIPPGTALIAGSPFTANVSLAFNTAGSQLVTLSASSLEGGCSTVESVMINVENPPVATVSTPSQTCLGDSVMLAIGYHTDNADSFVWHIGNTLLSGSTDLNIITQRDNSGGPFLISWTTTGIHTIELYTQSKAGCRSALTRDTVKVSPPPDATFKVLTKGTLCLEDSALFNANTASQNNRYVWTPSHYFYEANQPQAWGRMEESRSLVTLTVTDPLGCKASTTQELDPDACCKALFPSAFSPNGDGRNDHFYPIFSGFHRFHDFVITNRWGQPVFESTNSDGQWDGTYNGEPQDMGVYYYYLRYDCGGNTLISKGDVTLVR